MSETIQSSSSSLSSHFFCPSSEASKLERGEVPHSGGEGLEARITRLEDIEAIRQLQAKYQRCLDTRDFDGVESCFTEDAQSAYGNGSMSYDGREAIMAFLRRVMTKHIPSTHLIHGGEIDVDGEHAHAKWYLEDYLNHRIFLLKLHGAAIYDVDYVKEYKTENGIVPDGTAVWRIKKIGYTRCYQYFAFRGFLNLLTLGKTTFLDNMRPSSPSLP